MKPLERVGLCLQHKEADRIPVYPLINSVARKLVGATYSEMARDEKICAEAYIKATEKLDLDVICTLIDLSVEAADFGQKLIYPQQEAPHPDLNNRLLKSVEDFRMVEPIDPRKAERMNKHIKLCEILTKAKGKDIPVVAFVFGPLGIASMLRGQAEIFMDIIDDPDTVKLALEAITQTLIDYADALIETGAHAIMLDTLFASQSIMSKQMWLDIEGPYVEKLAKHIHSKGCMVMIHNCGTGIYMDAQIQTMNPELISFLHIADDCKSFGEMKEKYGTKTTLMGHISPGWLMTATPEEVEIECKNEIDTFKKGGGFILSTGCEYPSGANFDNAEIIVRIAKEYGKY